MSDTRPMIPIRDVIPTRTTAYVSIALASVHAGALVYVVASGRASAGLMVYLGLIVAFVWLFGENVEDRTGHARFLALYVLCGIAAALVQAGLSPTPDARIAGAGGATAGVLGAYLVLYPQSRIVTLVPLVTVVHPVEVPSIAFVVFWFLFQWSAGTLGAHLAAFATGMCSVLVFRRAERLRVEWWSDVRRPRR